MARVGGLVVFEVVFARCRKVEALGPATGESGDSWREGAKTRVSGFPGDQQSGFKFSRFW